jgi:hypothetical protein
MEQNKEPHIIEQVKNLGGAIFDWATQDGFSLVQQDLFNKRKTICQMCEHWDQGSFGGKGKCKLCGCSVAKLYIPSSNCPAHPPKWGPTSI